MARSWCWTLLLCIFFFAGCGKKKDEYDKNGRLIIHYWEKWSGFELEAMQAVVDAYNDSQDRVFVKMLQTSTIDQKLMLATAGGNPPDIAGLWSHNIPVFAEKGALMPLGGKLEKAGITRDSYIPVYWDICSHRGFTWAIPSTPSTLAMHWNKRMFRDAGLDPDKPPRTLKELEEMNERLTIVMLKRAGKVEQVQYAELTVDEKQAKDFEIVQIGYTPSEPGWWNALWPYWFGGRLWDGKDQITATAPECVAALDWYRGFPEKYGLENLQSFGSSFGNFSSPQNAFLSEKVAIVLQGVWMYNFIEKYNPGLEWAAAPFPGMGKLSQGVTLAESDVLVIPKGARHPEEAFDFIKFVASQKGMELLNMGQRKFSPLATTSAEFLKKHPNPYIKVFIDMAKSPDARNVPRIPIWNEYDTEMRVAIEQCFLGIKPAEDALADVQKRIEWKFGRLNRRWKAVRSRRLEEWSKLNDSW